MSYEARPRAFDAPAGVDGTYERTTDMVHETIDALVATASKRGVDIEPWEVTEYTGAISHDYEVAGDKTNIEFTASDPIYNRLLSKMDDSITGARALSALRASWVVLAHMQHTLRA